MHRRNLLIVFFIYAVVALAAFLIRRTVRHSLLSAHPPRYRARIKCAPSNMAPFSASGLDRATLEAVLRQVAALRQAQGTTVYYGRPVPAASPLRPCRRRGSQGPAAFWV